VTLGRATYLRGYAERRFRDRTGWWSSVEYRYPLFEFGASGLGASSTLFIDVGEVASSYAAMSARAVRYSYGVGVRADTLTTLVLRLQLGLSPEGAQVTLSLNEAYDRR
jgi:hemolysin activation/secretion protein